MLLCNEEFIIDEESLSHSLNRLCRVPMDSFFHGSTRSKTTLLQRLMRWFCSWASAAPCNVIIHSSLDRAHRCNYISHNIVLRVSMTDSIVFAEVLFWKKLKINSSHSASLQGMFAELIKHYGLNFMLLSSIRFCCSRLLKICLYSFL